MRILGAAIVCALALYTVDALYCDGEYFSAFQQWFTAAAHGY